MSDHEPEDPNDELGDLEATTAVLDALGPSLRDRAVWSEPPASLGDSIVAAIAAEREGPGSGGVGERSGGPAQPMIDDHVVTSPAPPATADLDVQRRRRRPGRWLGAVAAAALALAIGAGLLLTREGDEQPGDQLAITGTDLAPDASATAVVDDTGAGVAIRLDLRGLEPAPEGQYYQGWLRNAEGELVSIGTFHMRDGDATITLWAGVEVKDYPTLTVTLQTEDEGTGSSGQVVLRGSLTDA